MADRVMADKSRSAQAAAAAETVASGLGLLASALSTIRTDDTALAAGRQAVAPLLPALVDLLGAAEPAHGAGDNHVMAECRSCPVCRLLAMVRLLAPDLVDGVGDALDAVMIAVRDALESAGDFPQPTPEV